MIQKTLLLSLLLLLNSCSLESLLALGEVDKVQVVKQNASVSQYRAYFQRTRLEPIKNKRKYLYFYNKKKKDLAILLRYHTHYTLYSLFHPQAKITIQASRKTSYSKVAKALKKKGYVLTHPRDIGASTRVALRRFKGFKTLMVEVKKYHHLPAKYKKSKTGNKQIQPSIIPDVISTEHEIEEKEVNLALEKETPEVYAPILSTPSYNYYAQKSSYEELNRYLSDEETKNTLSFNQYKQLKQRIAKLKEEKLLRDGSLEELISAYKVNKNAHYKSRILELMKEAQK